MQNLIKIFHMVQEVCSFLLTDHRRMDRRINSHSNYSADPRVVKSTLLDKRNCCSLSGFILICIYLLFLYIYTIFIEGGPISFGS